MNDTLKAVGGVLAVNAGTLTITMLTNIDLVLKIGLSSCAIGYTLWRWKTDYNKNKSK